LLVGDEIVLIFAPRDEERAHAQCVPHPGRLGVVDSAALVDVESDEASEVWIVRIERGNRNMTVELDIDYNAQSVIACVLDNRGFERREFTPLMNAFMEAFD
jgi:hypothetical protein